MTFLSDLPDAMLTEIARRLNKLEDYTSFTCVSKSLRTAAKMDYFEGLRLRQRTPYLMLPVREGGHDDIRELYSLVEDESIVASVKVPNFKKKQCYESLGWLLVSEVDGRCSLLDPLSSTEIPLPHQNTFPEYNKYIMQDMDGYAFFEKMVLSSNPNECPDFVLVVIGGCLKEVAFWRLGDKAWTKIYKRKGVYTDVVHYGGYKFYAFCHAGYVWCFNLSATDNQIESCIVVSFLPQNVSVHERRRMYAGELGPIVQGFHRIYLLKSIDDSLLLIIRSTPKSGTTEYSYVSNKFRVYDLDVVRGAWKEIYSLGNMAVFLGFNSTTFVDASRLPGVVKPNHIYFTDDNWELYGDENLGLCGGYDSGVYNFETGSIEPVYPGEPLLSKFSPAFWITPCF